jgi:hypothetical protein
MAVPVPVMPIGVEHRLIVTLMSPFLPGARPRDANRR